ncbi:MAG: hypothetical protein HOH04_16795 [Rhodospirillaceae bacterium]|nr:hypothetical protein [Rhodospirillaceae bacterium]
MTANQNRDTPATSMRGLSVKLRMAVAIDCMDWKRGFLTSALADAERLS